MKVLKFVFVQHYSYPIVFLSWDTEIDEEKLFFPTVTSIWLSADTSYFRGNIDWFWILKHSSILSG